MIAKLVWTIELCALAAATSLLVIKSVSYHQRSEDLREQLLGYQSADIASVQVTGSPIVTDADKLFDCGKGSSLGMRTAHATTILFLLLDYAQPAVGQSDVNNWRDMLHSHSWTPQSQVWLISPHGAADGLASNVSSDGVQRCTIRDTGAFVLTTGLGDVPAAALFRNSDLVLFESGLATPSVVSQFEDQLTGDHERSHTPFIYDAPGRSLSKKQGADSSKGK